MDFSPPIPIDGDGSDNDIIKSKTKRVYGKRNKPSPLSPDTLEKMISSIIRSSKFASRQIREIDKIIFKKELYQTLELDEILKIRRVLSTDDKTHKDHYLQVYAFIVKNQLELEHLKLSQNKLESSTQSISTESSQVRDVILAIQQLMSEQAKEDFE